MDSNLLKEAIADAKAVRKTALANAKVALEEAFSEKYQAMFAEKLKEDAAMGESQPAATAMNPTEATVSEQEIDELIKELESEVGEEPSAEPHAEPDGDEIPPAAGAAPAVPPVPLAPGAQMVMCPVGQIATAAMPPAPVPGVGGEIPPAMPAAPGAAPIPPVGAPPAGEIPAAPAGGEVPPATPPSEVPPVSGDEEETDEDVDLNELLQSLKEEVEEEEEGYEAEEEAKKLDEAKKLASSGIGGGKAGGSDNKKPTSAASSTSAIESGGMKQEGVPSVDSTKVGPSDATTASRPNEGSHATKDNLSTPSMGGKGGSGGGGGGKGIKGAGVPSVDSTKENNPDSVARPNEGSNATKDNLSTPGGMLKENEDLKKKLNEAYDVIKYVKGQLNEVNLLNGKLLYTNKLFKEYNMNNEQKMRIVEMFDLAKTIREVKLTYANIAESLNFGGSDIKKKVVAKTNSSVQSITEGLASKPVGSTKPKDIISEGKFASRMKQLAGIRSEPKK